MQLHQLLFTAYHGVHEEEKVLGNEYMVDCAVEFYENTGVIYEISETVNYADIYDIIKRRMAIPARLLETVVMEIGNEIFLHYPDLKSIDISVKKLHPLIEGLRGAVGVSWHKKY